MATLSTSYFQSLLVLTSLLILPNFSIQGAEQQNLLQQSLTVVDKTHQQQKKSQQNINKISNETQKLLKAYQQLNRNTQYQLAYQEQLQKTLTAQEDKKQNLLNKIDNVKTTQQQILPLIEQMTETLSHFIELDLPFNLEKRTLTVNKLKKLIADPQVSMPDKFYQLLSLYKEENLYGYSTDAYQGQLTDGSNRQVTFLRIGRLSLYYQTLDGRESGYWNLTTKVWLKLASSYNVHIKKSIKIAQNKVVPSTMLLPILVPKKLAVLEVKQ
ncbi:MAG: DUF3450 domain-containing protein [Alteromonadaceae bacterium]|nr:DUF3450 domain-containing protein [Alteromonadaceae bacterium]